MAENGFVDFRNSVGSQNGVHSRNGQHGGEGHSARGLPPHIVWPMAIISLLLMSVGWSMWVVFAARSDGGAQVVENYYQKALNWDERNQLLSASDALGWEVTLQFERASASNGQAELVARFVDSEGRPVRDLAGGIKAFRPQTTAVIEDMPLTEIPGEPGIYRQVFENPVPGLWDFEVDVNRGDARYLKVFRKELSF